MQTSWWQANIVEEDAETLSKNPKTLGRTELQQVSKVSFSYVFAFLHSSLRSVPQGRRQAQVVYLLSSQPFRKLFKINNNATKAKSSNWKKRTIRTTKKRQTAIEPFLTANSPTFRLYTPWRREVRQWWNSARNIVRKNGAPQISREWLWLVRSETLNCNL